MLSDFHPSGLRKTAVILTLLASGLLSACQVRPLYEEQGNAVTSLPAIAYSEASDRITQQLRNRLIFLTGGGAGEPQAPQYSVKLQVTSLATDVLAEKATTTMKTGNITVSASYSLSRLPEGTIVKVGKRQVSIFVYYPLQEFAKLRAIRDAEDRAASELAELIRADLAAALGR